MKLSEEFRREIYMGSDADGLVWGRSAEMAEKYEDRLRALIGTLEEYADGYETTNPVHEAFQCAANTLKEFMEIPS